MKPPRTGEVLENLDRRVERIEQILPTLATKEDLRPLATKDELKMLATKDELEENIKEEGATSRRYMKVLTEEIKSQIALFAEKLDVVDRRDARQHADTIKRHAAMEKRVTALEASRSKRRQP